MNRRSVFSIVAGGCLMVLFMAFHPSGTVLAQCGGPQQPPCNKPSKTPRQAQPPPTTYTATPTETSIPTEVPANAVPDTPTLCVERVWYKDADLDGYGTASSTTTACTQPIGYAENNKDCNDANAAIHPGATDICGDGIDQDCDASDAVCAAPVNPNTSTVPPPTGIPPWLLGGGGLLIGILIGMVVGSFFDLRNRKPAPGSSNFDTEMRKGKGTPGGGDDGGDPHEVRYIIDKPAPGGGDDGGDPHEVRYIIDKPAPQGGDDGGDDPHAVRFIIDKPVTDGSSDAPPPGPGIPGPGEGPDFDSGIGMVSERDVPEKPVDGPNRPDPPQPPRLDGMDGIGLVSERDVPEKPPDGPNRPDPPQPRLEGTDIGIVSTVGGPGGEGPGDVSTVSTVGGPGSGGPGDVSLAAREAALNAREAALKAREAALKAREAALRGSTSGE